jgi:hypothetical protein
MAKNIASWNANLKNQIWWDQQLFVRQMEYCEDTKPLSPYDKINPLCMWFGIGISARGLFLKQVA